MRWLILSDIHANRQALDAVLAASSGRYDQIVCCGDIVGYGPDPNYAVEFCRARCETTIRGNHDKGCAGILRLTWFNDSARASCEWTEQVLSPDNLEWLRGLPQGPAAVGSFMLCHGTPGDEDEYLLGVSSARNAARSLAAPLLFFGHTHIQGGFLVHRNGVRPAALPLIVPDPTETTLVNPGSVGQPRDGDPRAAYGLYDDEAGMVELHRTEYDVETTAKRIAAAGLPLNLGMRLFVGR